MGLAEPRTSEQEKRIESGLARVLGYALPCRNAHLVAFPFHKVAETVVRVELGIDLYPLESRNHERIRRTCLRVGRDRHRFVFRSIAMRRRIRKRRLDLYRPDRINQFCVRTDLPLHHFFQDIQIIVFEIFPEKFGRDLHCKGTFRKRHRPDRLEPSFKRLRADDILDYRQTSFPYKRMIFLSHQRR